MSKIKLEGVTKSFGNYRVLRRTNLELRGGGSLVPIGAATLSITSNIKSARHIADQIAIIHEGKVICCGAGAGADNSNNAYFDQFIYSRAGGPFKMAAISS